MRQAGRYLPEYRASRSRAGDFLTLCKTPELACEVTLQPLARFNLDAAIIFSDILTIPDAMGLGLSIEEGTGPRFERPLQNAADIQSLRVPDPMNELRYVMDAIEIVVRELEGSIPLIGFSGSPWTLATYMVEGQGSRNFHLIKKLIYDQPELAHQLLGVLAESVQVYLEAQASAGAQALMIFDTWGGILTSAAYQRFSLDYLSHIVAGLKSSPAKDVPVILFTKGGGMWLESIAATGCDGIGLDWTIDPAAARQRVGGRVALQGNLDPAILCAAPAIIEQEVGAVLTAFGAEPGHIFNLGHGITPDIEPDHVAALVNAVHEKSRRQE
jgi:uroporphyrinogen decarboxylase